MSLLRRLVWGLLLVSLAGTASAQTHHTREDAVALVDRAASLVQAQGRGAAFAAFDDPHGAFVDGDLYIYVMDANDPKMTMLAHGVNPLLIGAPQNDVVDADGHTFNDDTARVARTAGSGWVTYRWPNPVTKKIGIKSSYVRLVDGLIIGAGVYQ